MNSPRLLLALTCIGISLQENVLTPSPTNQSPYKDLPGTPNIGPNSQSGHVANIVRLFGTIYGRNDTDVTCILGDDHFIPSNYIHCLHVNEITNITEALCGLNQQLNTYPQGNVNEVVSHLKDISAQARTFSKTDFLLMWRCLRSMSTIVVDENYFVLVNNLLESNFANYSLHYILESFRYGVAIIETDFTIVNPDLVLKIWHPFKCDVRGVALYGTPSQANSYQISTIYNNQSSDDIALEDLKFAGYVPSNFLDKFPDEHKSYLYVIMIMVMNGKKYNGALELNNEINHYIGVSIPWFCKKNHEPMLTAYFAPQTSHEERKWIEFGREYFDSLNGHECFLPKMSYFGKWSSEHTGLAKAKIIRSCEEITKQFILHTFFALNGQLIYETSKEYDALLTMFIQRTVNGMVESKEEPKITSDTQVLYLNWTFYQVERQNFEINVDHLHNKSMRFAGKDEAKENRLNSLIQQRRQRTADEIYQCLLEAIFEHQFARRDLHFETVKEEYCLERKDSNGMYWRQTLVGDWIVPREFCLDRYLIVPYQYCYRTGTFHAHLLSQAVYMECVPSHPISNTTHRLYYILSECMRARWSRDCITNPSILMEMIFNYVDAMLVMYIFDFGYTSLTMFKYAFDKFLYCLGDQAVDKPQLSYLAHISRRFAKLLQGVRASIGRYFILIFFHITPETLGFVVYRQGHGSFLEYSIAPITLQNATASHSSNKDVEVVFYLDHSSYASMRIAHASIHAFIYYNNNFSEYNNYTSASRILGLESTHITTPPLNFKIYLKRLAINSSRMSIYDREEGHWFTLTLPNSTVVLSSIIEPLNDPCDTTSQLLIHQTYAETRKHMFERNAVDKNNLMRLDFLSQLVVQVNVETRELHKTHSKILETISFCLGILSELALLCIFVTVSVIKNWHKRRFCSLQLCVATAGETSFFLMKNPDVGHVGYVVFYYFILAQFAWMIILAYIQYIKYIKVFGTTNLGTWKPLFFGWMVPLAITAGLIFSHMECFRCNLCSKNGFIFTYFIMIPISVAIVCNLVIYIYVVVSISRDTSHMTPEVKKARLRTIIMFPFILGIFWIFILAIHSPWAWISLVGSYFFHIIAPSQGIIPFVFLVALDNSTIMEWRKIIEKMKKAILCSNTEKKD